jgi:hypothetical protein
LVLNLEPFEQHRVSGQWAGFVKFCRIVADGQICRSFTDSFTDTLPLLRRNLLEVLHLRVEPMAGIEPATDGLRNRCSTTELHWQSIIQQKFILFYKRSEWNILEELKFQGKLIRRSLI